MTPLVAIEQGFRCFILATGSQSMEPQVRLDVVCWVFWSLSLKLSVVVIVYAQGFGGLDSKPFFSFGFHSSFSMETQVSACNMGLALIYIHTLTIRSCVLASFDDFMKMHWFLLYVCKVLLAPTAINYRPLSRVPANDGCNFQSSFGGSTADGWAVCWFSAPRLSDEGRYW